MFRRYLALLKTEFSGYGMANLRKDLLAGITVSAVALPLALAFGVSSGATAAAGLITAIIAGLMIGALSGSSFQISGPTGAMSAILISIAARHGIKGVLIACLIAGAVLIVCGVFKLGKIVSIIPMPVITGFTSGIAVIIAFGQMDNFFGVTSQGYGVIEKLISYGRLGFNINSPSLTLGLLVAAVMIFWPKKFNNYIPGSLAALTIVLIANAFLKLDVMTVGEIPRTLILKERLAFADINPEIIHSLMIPALSIAALGMIESLLCGAAAAKMKGDTFDGDIELVSQGIGNIVIPFFGGVPATAAIARTSVAIKAGGATRLTGIFHAAGLLLSMFLLSGIMSKIPMSALAGVLIITAWRMNDWSGIKYIFKSKFKTAISGYLLTMMATVFFDLSVAVIAGVVFSALMFVVNSSELEISASDVDYERMNLSDNTTKTDHIKVIYLTGAIFFGTVNVFIEKMEKYITGKTIILSMRGVPGIDTTAIQEIIELCRRQKEKGGEVLFCCVQKAVFQVMEKGGLVKLVGIDKFHWSADEAIIRSMKKKVGSEGNLCPAYPQNSSANTNSFLT